MHKPAREILYDSEAALRLVDSALHDIAGTDVAFEAATTPPPPTEPNADVLAAVVRSYRELTQVVLSLQQSRGFLQRSAVERLQHTQDKLRQVSSATESAATDILDGLDRATALVDALDEAGQLGPDAPSADIRRRLREELFALVGHMQFQDITSQQLQFASAVLSEMEERVSAVVRALEPTVAGYAAEEASPPPAAPGPTWDPNATVENRDERQAVADAIVTARRSSA